jgi:putative transposase
MPKPRIHKENENIMHFITITVIDWINIFTKPVYFDVINESFKYCQEHKGLLLFEYVIMTNHIHIIAQAKEGFKLSQFVSDFKKFTSDEIEKWLEKDNRKWILPLLRASKSKKKGYKMQIWQRENEPMTVESEKYYDKWANYIWHNPVKEEYVKYAEEWEQGSARYRLTGDVGPVVLSEFEE